MSINLNVTDDEKKRMANLLTECQVLDHLLKERQSLLQTLCSEFQPQQGHLGGYIKAREFGFT